MAGLNRPAVFALRLDLRWLNHFELSVARSLGRWGVPVWGVRRGGVAVATSRFSAGRLPFDPQAPLEEKLERLLTIGRELGRPLLVPIDDEASVLVDDHAEPLQQAFRFPVRPDGLARRLADKGELHRTCEQLGIATPRASFPQSREEVDAYADSGPFPVVLKRMAAWLPAAGEPTSVEIARSAAELLDAYERMESPERPNVMLQEHLPGGPTAVWMFNGYFDEHSRCLAGFTGVKLRQSGGDTGATSLGLCRRNPRVLADASRLLSTLGYRGVVDMGYRYDLRDGRYKLLDVNPRLGSSFRLFVDSNGNDVLRALYLDLTGHSVATAGQCDGRKWAVESFEAISAVRAARAGQLVVRPWLRSLRGVHETAWFAADDPLPFAAMCVELPLQMARRRPRASDGRRLALPSQRAGDR